MDFSWLNLDIFFGISQLIYMLLKCGELPEENSEKGVDSDPEIPIMDNITPNERNYIMNASSTFVRENIDSSNIEAYAYDSVTQKLTIEFKSGSVYNYLNIEEDIAVEFDAAESKGKYHSTNIRGEYDFEKL